MDLKEAYKTVLKDLTKEEKSLFNGFHTGNEDDDFMFGIQEVMSTIAEKAGDDEFEGTFIFNAISCLSSDTDKYDVAC